MVIALAILLAAIAADSEASAEQWRSWGVDDVNAVNRSKPGAGIIIGTWDGQPILLTVQHDPGLYGHGVFVVLGRVTRGGTSLALPLYPERKHSAHRSRNTDYAAARSVSRTTAVRWMRALAADPVSVRQLRLMIVVRHENGAILEDGDWRKIRIDGLDELDVDWRPNVPIPEDADALG